jgi:hypothetical protein
MVVLLACESMKQFLPNPSSIIFVKHSSIYQFTLQDAHYHIIFQYLRSKIHHWDFQKLVFDIAFTKIIVTRYIYNNLIKSALKAHRVIHTWWLDCPDEGDGKNKTDLMRLIDIALTSKLHSIMQLKYTVSEAFFLSHYTEVVKGKSSWQVEQPGTLW